jgi:hypothetical protein
MPGSVVSTFTFTLNILFFPRPIIFVELFLEIHPCLRDCSVLPRIPMTCGYSFSIEESWILSPACGACPNVTEDCSNIDCIPANGVHRSVAVVNRMLPGPAVRVKADEKEN